MLNVDANINLVLNDDVNIQLCILYIVLEISHDTDQLCSSINYFTVASFPGLLRLQFLIICKNYTHSALNFDTNSTPKSCHDINSLTKDHQDQALWSEKFSLQSA